MSAATSASRSFQFSSPAGRALCKQILARHFPYVPHDYQLEGICKALDGVDLLAVTPTGSGKTGFLTMYLVVARELAREPSLYPSPGGLPDAFRKDPVMLVVCPTKSLEMDMLPKFEAAGLSALVINADTIESARHCGRDLWEEACAPDVAAVLLAPEQLRSKGFEGLLANKPFARRVVAVGVDEVHLLVTWGVQFRPIFRQIGHVRLRLPASPVLVALTATLRPGPQTEAVCGFLGLRTGVFHHIRRSNARHDVRLIFRSMQSGQRAIAFPELNWVLEGDRRIIIFCSTIALGFRVASYLWDQARQLPDRSQRIRLYNALNWPSYNSETLQFMHNDNRSRVTIATDTLAVGIDAAGTDDVVIYGDAPPDSDMLLQKLGRIRDGRNKASRAFVYLPRSTMDAAKKALSAPPSRAVASKETSRKSSRKDAIHLDASIAHLIVAECKVDEIDRLYGNRDDEIPCTCQTCGVRPRVLRKTPCDCSGCMTDSEPGQLFGAANLQSATASPTGTSPSAVPSERPQKAKRKGVRAITKKMRERGMERLKGFRMQLWNEANECEAGMIPSMLFLPDTVIKAVLDNFAAIVDVNALVPIVYKCPFLDEHHEALQAVVQELRQEFEAMRAIAKAAAAAKRKATRERKMQEAQAATQDDNTSSSNAESERSGVECDPEDSTSDSAESMGDVAIANTEAAESMYGTLRPRNSARPSAGRIVIPPLRRSGAAVSAHPSMPTTSGPGERPPLRHSTRILKDRYSHKLDMTDSGQVL